MVGEAVSATSAGTYAAVKDVKLELEADPVVAPWHKQAGGFQTSWPVTVKS